jgi:hypothetical protein
MSAGILLPASAVAFVVLLITLKARCVSWAQPAPRFTTEFYDPAQHKFTAGPSMRMRRWGAVAAVLADGRAFITGGNGQNPGPMAEIFDLRDGAFYGTGDPIWFRITGQTATRLQNGKVLIAGGRPDCSSQVTAAL